MSKPAPANGQKAWIGNWSTYFSERFPPLQNGVLIAAFTFGVGAYTAATTVPRADLNVAGLVVGFVSVFLMILQLRVLDEFKDAEDDARFRPYRPVPRGLVSLGQLRRLWFVAAAVQLACAPLIDIRLLWGLLAIWVYSGLMGVEFFVPSWLKAHALLYMLSHVVIVPMLAAYLAACQWLPAGGPPPDVAWLLASCYFAFCVIEVGRKLRAPADEQQGVETYSKLWDRGGAISAWLAFLAASGGFAILAAAQLGAGLLITVLLGTVFILGLLVSLRFLADPAPGSGDRFNLLSGVWTLTLFLGLGLEALL